MLTDLPPPVINNPALPLVSIVTPSYNQGPFIRETIASVLGQDYPNIEHWVIDGGSSDETLSILREYEADPRFHWLSERDNGQSEAINKGLARCHGEIFAWVNSDDLLKPGALARVAEAWQVAGGPVLIYGLTRRIDAEGRDLGFDAPVSTNMTLEKLLRLEAMFSQPSTFMPCALVRELGGVNERLHYAMDEHLFARLGARVPYQFVSAELAAFREHAGSKTISQTWKFIADLRIAWWHLADAALISPRRARAYADLFAVRIFLNPEGLSYQGALRHTLAALLSHPPVITQALAIWVRGLVRLLVGDQAWALVRAAKLKLGM
jgi:glycosyltransferase involved in cell wall biosynthesis